MAFFETLTKLKAGLAKTRDSIVNKVQRLAATKSKIDDELLNQLEEILIAGDVGVETANLILANLKQRVKETKYESTDQLVILLKKEVTAILQAKDNEDPSLANVLKYQQQLEGLNKNLSALNSVYELQKKGADDHLKESESLYKGLQGLMKDLTDSAGDTKKYREQITKLNDNLSALNNVYGNMLSAMNVK